MKTSRFTDSQIIAVLKQAEAGASVPELCREHGISSATFYKWSPLKNPQTTSIARLHLRYRCAGIASFRYATSWFLAVFAHAYTPSCRRAVACR